MNLASFSELMLPAVDVEIRNCIDSPILDPFIDLAIFCITIWL